MSNIVSINMIAHNIEHIYHNTHYGAHIKWTVVHNAHNNVSSIVINVRSLFTVYLPYQNVKRAEIALGQCSALYKN